VLRGARVLTMDEAKPEAEAIALVDGKIAAVGTDADVEQFLEGAKVYDLPAGALVLPGFQDSHNHLIWSAAQAEDISLTDVADEAGLRAAIEPVMAQRTGPYCPVKARPPDRRIRKNHKPLSNPAKSVRRVCRGR